VGFGTVAAAACLLAPLVGSTHIHLGRAFDRSTPYADNIDAQIFFVARLPRVLAAALVGSALALSGVVFQALLAIPWRRGHARRLRGRVARRDDGDYVQPGFLAARISAVPLASFAGSIGALTIVYGFVTRGGGTSTMVLLLGGVTLHALLSAVIAFVQYLADFTQTFRNVRWLMGSLDVASYSPLAAALAGDDDRWAGFAMLPRILDLISVGSESAAGAARQRRTGGTRGARQRVCSRPERQCRSPGRFSLSASSCRTWSADRRLRPSAVLPGVGALRRGISHRLRSRGAYDHRAAGAAGRHRHRHYRRSVFLWLLFRRA